MESWVEVAPVLVAIGFALYFLWKWLTGAGNHSHGPERRTLPRGQQPRRSGSAQGGSRNRRRHVTRRGEVVKSGSEVAIADFLDENGIEYEYERPLTVPAEGGRPVTFHPDFYLPDLGPKGTYWEHFGFNSPDYYLQASKKSSLYAGANLRIIMTKRNPPTRGEMMEKLRERGWTPTMRQSRR